MQWWTSKLTWLVGMPVVASLVAILCVVQQQAESLAHTQRTLLETSLMASKEGELRGYVRLARSMLAPLIRSDGGPAEQALLVRTLERLEFGHDGYFYLYEAGGRSLVSPRQPELAGRNLWDWHDAEGQPTVQRLLAVSGQGGGTLRYRWEKPSSGRPAPKLGYVEPIAEYGLTIGTGLYLDDIERGLADIDAQARASIRRTSVLILAIAAGGVLGVGLLACALHRYERRDSRRRLRRLAQRAVVTRDDERQRLAGELHDGVGQVLVSAKLLVETAVDTARDAPASPPADDVLPRAVDRLNLALVEMRRISRGLHPAALEHGALPLALRRLLDDFGRDTGIAVHADVPRGACPLPAATEATLFRITQETLANVARHAAARRVVLVLACTTRQAELSIADDGHGFDTGVAAEGLGLRSLRERAAALGATLAIRSGPAGTEVLISVPLEDTRAGAPHDPAPSGASIEKTHEAMACPLP